MQGATMFDMTNDLNNYLAPNERVVWQGQGVRKIWSVANPGVLFALIFGGIAAFMLVMFLTISSSSRSRSSDTQFLVFLPLLFIVIGLSVGIPLMLMGRGAGNARYIVTTAAAMIVNDKRWGGGKRTTIIPLKNIAQLSFTENRDGTGTITFGSNPFAAYGRYNNTWLMDSASAFSNIEKPMEVYQLIRKQMGGE
jgi:hypothetical protein